MRFIGVTGHGTRVAGDAPPQPRALPVRLRPAAVQLHHAAHAEYAADLEALLALCRERGVAVQTIKSVARRRWQDEAQRRFSWYEPLRDPDAIRRAVHFVLAAAGLFLNTSSDATLLRTSSTPPPRSVAAPVACGSRRRRRALRDRAALRPRRVGHALRRQRLLPLLPRFAFVYRVKARHDL